MVKWARIGPYFMIKLNEANKYKGRGQMSHDPLTNQVQMFVEMDCKAVILIKFKYETF